MISAPVRSDAAEADVATGVNVGPVDPVVPVEPLAPVGPLEPVEPLAPAAPPVFPPAGPLALLGAKTIISAPFCLYAGEARIAGTHVFRNASSPARPPGAPSGQESLAESSHSGGAR